MLIVTGASPHCPCKVSPLPSKHSLSSVYTPQTAPSECSSDLGAETMTRTAGNFAGHFLVLGLVGALANCSSIPEQWAEGRKGQSPGVTPLRPLAQISLKNLADDYAAEPQSGAPIAVGLALSGGGTRAAMFAHGVFPDHTLAASVTWGANRPGKAAPTTRSALT